MWHQLFDASAWIGERLAIGSLQGAVIIGLAWAACRCIPRVPAALQTWVWWLVAAKLVVALLPLPAVPVPLLPASGDGAAARPLTVQYDKREPRGGRAHRSNQAGAILGGRVRVTWFALFAGVWLVGVLLHGLLLVRAVVTARSLVRRATRLSSVDLAAVSRMAAAIGLTRLPRVCTSPEVTVPQVIGFQDPVVLLPADARGRFTPEEWQMALGDELMHVRRRDVLLGCVPALAERGCTSFTRWHGWRRTSTCWPAKPPATRQWCARSGPGVRLRAPAGASRRIAIAIRAGGVVGRGVGVEPEKEIRHAAAHLVEVAVPDVPDDDGRTGGRRPAGTRAGGDCGATPAGTPRTASAASGSGAARRGALEPCRPRRPTPRLLQRWPAPPAPPAQAAPAAPVARPVAPPLPPQPPLPPSSDEVVLRLKSPATEARGC